jgi:hypothetical protein
MADLEMRAGRLALVLTDVDPAPDAHLLQAVAGPGAPEVLELVPGPHGRLVITVLPPLRLGDLGLTEAAEALATAADVLARAHATGLTHGPIRAEHLQGTPGDVLLGGWSADVRGSSEHDVASLGRWIEQAAERHPPLRVIAQRALAAEPPTAAAIAGSLRATGRGNERKARRNHAQFVKVAGVTTAIVGILALAVAAPRGQAAGGGETTPPTTTRAEPVVVHEGRRLRIGGSGDIVLRGRFECRSEIPAVFRPATGQLWVFPSIAVGEGTLVTTSPDATDVGYRRDGACDRLELRDAQGRWRAVG